VPSVGTPVMAPRTLREGFRRAKVDIYAARRHADDPDLSSARLPYTCPTPSAASPSSSPTDPLRTVREAVPGTPDAFISCDRAECLAKRPYAPYASASERAADLQRVIFRSAIRKPDPRERPKGSICFIQGPGPRPNPLQGFRATAFKGLSRSLSQPRPVNGCSRFLGRAPAEPANFEGLAPDERQSTSGSLSVCATSTESRCFALCESDVLSRQTSCAADILAAILAIAKMSEPVRRTPHTSDLLLDGPGVRLRTLLMIGTCPRVID